MRLTVAHNAGTPVSGGVSDTASLPELTIVFYTPPPVSNNESASTSDTEPRWQKLAKRAGTIAGSRLDVHTLLEHIPPSTSGDTPLQTASKLSTYVSSLDGERKGFIEFLLVSLCAVLYESGRAAPEKIDEILKAVVKSSNPRYLDRVRRGVKLANQIIAEWATCDSTSVDKLQRLDRATQAVLQCKPVL